MSLADSNYVDFMSLQPKLNIKDFKSALSSVCKVSIDFEDTNPTDDIAIRSIPVRW